MALGGSHMLIFLTASCSTPLNTHKTNTAYTFQSHSVPGLLLPHRVFSSPPPSLVSRSRSWSRTTSLDTKAAPHGSRTLFLSPSLVLSLLLTPPSFIPHHRHLRGRR